MSDKVFPNSQLPIRKTVELLPQVFQTSANDKFMSAVVDPLVQPGVLQKTVGYIGRRYGKTYKGSDIYLDTDNTLRSRYQLEPGVVYKEHDVVKSFYDYLDLKNQLVFFGNTDERDNKIMSQKHYAWNPPINWDKFVNYREYYWIPSGPPAVSIYGQSSAIRSTYSVKIGTQSSFIFTPDGKTNNPSIVLYRGQTYNFKVNAPYEGFVIRTNYDTGSLLFDPSLPYAAGELVVYDEKLWKAKVAVSPRDGSSITLDSEDWEFVETITTSISSLDYNKGVTNNGVENGTLTFEVPYDAPDILYYQSRIDPNKVGRFVIADIESNTKINIDKEVLGKKTYTSSNGVVLSNGMVVNFLGQVTPTTYATDNWLVEGVGEAITLTRFIDLEVPKISQDSTEVLFDDAGFDTDPFDDASNYPGRKDYITIAKDSLDRNPWSRYNRWFHRSVLEYAYSVRGQEFPAEESSRAKRPIIEFESNLQLFNHGSVAKEFVDYVDDFTTDVFSIIEGSAGYNIDGEDLFEGARILVVNDSDPLANNKIYKVTFITHNNKKQIALREPGDTDPIVGQGVLVKRGKLNSGLMFHFDGTNWLKSQVKTKVNQPPLFDIFDNDGVSFGDIETYPTSSFIGSKILSYKPGSSIIDTELGFSISYLNIDNVGDIQFDWNCSTDTFTYYKSKILQTATVSTGFFKRNPQEFSNGWTTANAEFIQPIIDSVKVTSQTNTVEFSTIEWSKLAETDNPIINLYLNGERITEEYTRTFGKFTFTSTKFNENDVVVIKIITDLPPSQGYYEIPTGLEKNPLNQEIQSFTLGEATNHLSTALEFNNELQGPVLGSSNLRDISEYQSSAKRFLKHSGVAPLSFALLCDKTNNIIKSLQYAKKSYIEFKNNFMAKALELPYNNNIIDFVDDIISELAKTKNVDSPFWDSDMIGSGAYNSIDYIVEDTGIKTFALSAKFNLDELSRKAVYVYHNGSQLLNTKDYEFNSSFGFVTLKIDLVEGDAIQIREYISTAFNQIPPTPTVLGLYKKFTPKRFIDDTFIEPREVIQGHDGSITFTEGDFRDDLLLELEYRIYNNIKQKYDPNVFDIDKIIGGYYGNANYTKSQVDAIVSQEFLRWIRNTDINYTVNSYFQETNSFTYTYSNMTDPTGTQNLPGYWRGVYQWFYDTDRPHTCPWEMLGFSEQPEWWEKLYGPAPYTRNNLILWEDLRDGIIREGDRAGIHDRYKRPSLINHIPVDGDGKLLSPLDSGLAGNFTLINNRGQFTLGDVSPVEYAWRSGSEWPFAVIISLCLLKPLEFIPDNFDKSRVTVNKLGQTVSIDTNNFTVLNDLLIPRPGETQTSGLVQYLVGYAKSRGVSLDTVESKIKNLDVNLSSRLSGFVDKAQQKYILDSKNPKASSSNIYIPAENYDIIFNVSAPISSVTYSGVVVEKTDGGWLVSGYDDINPYFNYYEAVASQRDPIISVGGISETFSVWKVNTTYSNGQLVRFRTDFYRALKTHKSSEDFALDNPLWKKLPDVPVVGAIEAFRRKNFNKLTVKKVSYGTKFNSIQLVVDFLLGYEEYLKSIGFRFENYDNVNGVVQDWTTSSKEFMFWTKHNWAIGSLITLSPSAQRVDITVPVGVADSLVDSFYSYQVLKDDGKILPLNNIDVNRSFQNITVEPVNTTNGIYFIKVHYVLKEHVVIFDDRTVFNDVIYQKTTGYRRERIKTQGFRTVEWDGDYTSPGFLFDNVDIAVWQPFTDYKLGDIVAYKSYYWTSQVNQLGVEEFIDSNWTKLDLIPESGLVSNFDYRINQFDDYYDVYSEGVGEEQRKLARHAVAYQEREYLKNLAEDPVTQFQLYQGFIKEKGSLNAITKVFDKMGRSSDSVEVNEEWAFRVGRFGGLGQFREIEFKLLKDNFAINPQPIVVKTTAGVSPSTKEYQIDKSNFSISDEPFVTNINPVSSNQVLYRTAGYVKLDHVNFVVSTRDDILNLNIAEFLENDHVWVTFDNHTWAVLRFNQSPTLYITDIVKDGTAVTVSLSKRHAIVVGDIVGIKDVTNLTGFYKVTEVTYTTFTVESSGDEPILTPSINYINLLTPSRFDRYSSINQQQAALLKNGSKIWIDNNENDRWEVVEKQQQFTSKLISNFGTTSPLKTGTSVLYSELLQKTFVGMPGSGLVMLYSEGTNGLVLSQIIPPPISFKDNLGSSFGNKIALSPDTRFLVIATPNASSISNDYRGEFDPLADYFLGDIVLFEGRLWRALADIRYDGSSIDIYSEDWEPATVVPANPVGTNPGYSNQGMISVYEYKNQQWEISETLISPRPAADENFGSSVAICQSGSDYYMAVSAVGSMENTGRVYLYKYIPNESRSVTFSGSVDTEIDYETNTIKFKVEHGYYNGQRVEYVNGTIDGVGTSNATSPPPPEDNTVFFIVKVDQYRIRLAESLADVASLNSINLLDIGIDDSSYHTLIRDARPSGWQHLENSNYVGVYSSNVDYPAGSIVYYQGDLWTALVDVSKDNSTIGIKDATNVEWAKIDPISTHCSLPSALTMVDVDSVTSPGIIEGADLIELVKSGDRFGFSLAMSRDGKILAVGAPESDGQYFASYRGVWNSEMEYSIGDVVRFYDGEVEGYRYYRLTDADISTNEPPTQEPWTVVSADSTITSTGKVFVYQRTETEAYKLIQTISTDSLDSINDLVDDISINVGDQFGYAIDVDYSGSTLVVTSPKADINYLNQGSAYVFRTDGYAPAEYRLKQKLESFETIPNELFGQSVSISPNTEKIVIGAKNPIYRIETQIDSTKGTTFDKSKTRFSWIQGYAGGAYVFEIKDDTYFLTEKLDTELSPFESFGYSIDCNDTVIVVGSPDYVAPEKTNSGVTYDGVRTGMVRLFKKGSLSKSWKTLIEEEPLIDVEMIKSIALYDFENNLKIQDIDYVDHAKLKVLNQAEQEIKFKTLYDPATYNIGTEDQNVDPLTSWAEKQVGQLWWDLSKAKWKYYEQGDQAYRVGNWNSLAEGSSIDVYEWVETVLLPSEWSALADTNEGLAEGISGQPLYPNDDVYTIKEYYNSVTGAVNGTKYYYWVKNKVVVPNGLPGRRISAAQVASLISNPISSGNAFISLISSDTFLAYNFTSILSTDSAWLNIQYYKNNKQLSLIHNEYQLLTEGVADSLPTERLEDKWIDSLIGFNRIGNRVPNPNLPAKLRYGIEHRPNQSMFVDRKAALKITIDQINSILTKESFADTIDFTNLNLVDTPPIKELNLYDQQVSTYADLITVGTVRVKPAKLQVNIVDGTIDSIDVVSPGFGYKVPPPIIIDGDGKGAKATAVLNSQGGIATVIIDTEGKKYNFAIATVRNFSVLVEQDSTANNFWSIYAWDEERKVFFRTQTQAYDTTRYWSYIDWWKEGYGITSRIVKEISSVSEEPTIGINVGDLIRIREYANGGWAVFEKVASGNVNFLDNYTMVGRENGTIEINSSLYRSETDNIGYDNSYSYDANYYDVDSSKELSNILRAVKENIFVGDYAVEWNKLFFASIRYVFAEQQYVDWAFKTSFITAIHKIGELEQKLNYKNDNLESFREYLDEVKPYRTTIREYISKYNNNEPVAAVTTDFDLPAAYSSIAGKIVPVNSLSYEINQYPWKWWADNNGYSVVAIEISASGDQYTSAPKVRIDGNGTGAEATAYISNGKVSAVLVTNPGSGYTIAPTVSLVGGNSAGNIAKAVAILGDTKVRTFNLTMKFDRISKDGLYGSFDQFETFVAPGYSSVFELSYAPTRDKNKISIYRNNQLVLNNEYSISLFKAVTGSYSLLKGKVIFNEVPAKGDKITIQYEKNDQLLDSVNRIQKFYNPSLGMKGISTESFTINTKSKTTDSNVIEMVTSVGIRVGMRVTGNGVVNCRVIEILSEYIIRVSEQQTLDAGSTLRFSYSNPNQLMTGIDFGGVQIQGTTFDVTGGWDALPWFTDNWDSVEAASDYYVICDGSTVEITLPFTPADGQQITVYLKRAQETVEVPGLITDQETSAVTYDSPAVVPMPTIRIDDPNYVDNWDSSTATNPNAQMPTFIGDGSTNIVEIGRYISTNAGDTLIFRPIESDGSVTITDPNLLDTKLSGGSFLKDMAGAYSTATGKLAEEIAIDGSEFVNPEHVPAPEENVPGQVLDGVSIKVFNNSNSGAVPLQTSISIANGEQRIYNIGLKILENSSLMVYVDKIRRSVGTEPLDYSINFIDNTIDFVTAPAEGSIVEIIAVGLGGINLLDYQEFVADGETKLFLTDANFVETSKVYVTVNGIYQNIGFIDSSNVTGIEGRTVVEFGSTPERRSVVRIVCLGVRGTQGVTRSDIVKVNTQVFEYEGSTRTFDLDDFTNLSDGSALASTIVELNGRYLNGVDTNYYTLDNTFLSTDGSTYEFLIAVDPLEPPGSVLSSNITVRVNNKLQTFIQDYIYDGTRKVISFEIDKLSIGDVIRIENDLTAEYKIVNNAVQLSELLELSYGDNITVTWFSEYPSMQIISDEYTGGKVNYRLVHDIVDASYVWVYKNGNRLTQDKDYYVSAQRKLVYLTTESQPTDRIKIVMFGSVVFKLPAAFEIHKDMLNVYHFKRYSIGDVTLAKALNYYDQEILVNDSSSLDEPVISRNQPGVIYIGGEKIEYLVKSGNTLSQLRRGCFGTPIATTYPQGSQVVNLGNSETIPYNETQDRYDFVSDGSTLLVGPLDFTPKKSDRSFYRISSTSIVNNSTVTTYHSIPENYGACDEIEVFVAGRRLRKSSLTVYDEALGSSSPSADVELEAEFSVDGETGYIRLTEPAPAGARIFIIRRTGKIWYERGLTTASKGITFLDNDTAIARFIANSSTKLPE